MAPMGEGVELPGGRARLADVAGRRMLSVPATTEGFAGELVDDGASRFRLVELTSRAAERMRQLVPALAPRPLGKGRSSFGFGDRLGLATPGHIRALRLSGTSLAPVLAQQSARELERTDRDLPRRAGRGDLGRDRGWLDLWLRRRRRPPPHRERGHGRGRRTVHHGHSRPQRTR